jgi:hypothetical protein
VDDRPRFPGTLIYDPGADAAARYPEWVIRHRNIGGVIPEVLCRARKVIIIGTSQGPDGRRCSLAHAIAHLDLGHAEVRTSYFEKREERDADRLAADRLITLDQLGRALAWTRDYLEIATELRVDQPTLLTREKYLTAGDRAYLKAKVAWMEESA